MSNYTKLLLWEPSIYRAELHCKSCSDLIAPKSIFFINESDIKNLLPHNNGYDTAYSVRCSACGFKDFLRNEFGYLAKEAIDSHNLNNGDSYDRPFKASLKQLIREELKQILREEAFDPHGPFSPDP